MYIYIVNRDIFLYALLCTMVSVQNNVVHNNDVHNRVGHNNAVHNNAVHNNAVHNKIVHNKSVHKKIVHNKAVHNNSVSKLGIPDYLHKATKHGWTSPRGTERVVLSKLPA